MSFDSLVVNVVRTYPFLSTCAPQCGELYDDFLRHITCGWWKVNARNAAHVKYLFGAMSGRIVSAYEVASASDAWPTIPNAHAAVAAGRKYVPVTSNRSGPWMRAVGTSGPSQIRAIRYARLRSDAAGAALLFGPEAEMMQDELDE